MTKEKMITEMVSALNMYLASEDASIEDQKTVEKVKSALEKLMSEAVAAQTLAEEVYYGVLGKSLDKKFQPLEVKGMSGKVAKTYGGTGIEYCGKNEFGKKHVSYHTRENQTGGERIYCVSYRNNSKTKPGEIIKTEISYDENDCFNKVEGVFKGIGKDNLGIEIDKSGSVELFFTLNNSRSYDDDYMVVNDDLNASDFAKRLELAQMEAQRK